MRLGNITLSRLMGEDSDGMPVGLGLENGKERVRS
jgi:hypothetical protein